MLKNLRISNFALIDELELDFQTGMSTLTGETGAGKSILIDAISLIMGDRADSGMVRHAADRANIHADFSIETLPHIQEWLKKAELDSNGECLVRRTINPEGRSKAYINAQPVPLQSLKQLGEQLIEVHGQHEHQRLMKNEFQLMLLDGFAGIQEQVKALYSHYRQLRKLEQERAQLDDLTSEAVFQLQLLRFQVKELQDFDLNSEELESLHLELKSLSSADEVIREVSLALNELDGDDHQSVLSALSRMTTALSQLADRNEAIAEPAELLSTALIQSTEATTALRKHLDQIESNPEKLTHIEKRLADAADLARKHNIRVEDLPEHLQILQDELNTLENAGSRLEELNAELTEVHKTYFRLAETLSEQRHAAAPRLATEVTNLVKQLGMPEGQLKIILTNRDKAQYAATGIDKCDFLFSANPGHPEQAVAKIASGGELSRLGLAIKVATLNQEQIPTMIFDEVDTGVGGSIATRVGQLLRELADGQQVFCVTHQAQVASQGHHQFKVKKAVENGMTRTVIETLDESERVEELARMLSGESVTDQTRNLAQELLNGSEH